MPEPTPLDHPEFLLVDGGPTYLIQKRIGLIRQDSPLIVRRAVLAILFTWVPLLILAALQHHTTGNDIPVPFLKDFAVHARFLLALPLLIVAENVLGPHLAQAATHFIHSGVVVKSDYEQFKVDVEKGLKWRDSNLAEGIILALAFGISSIALRSLAVHVSTWYAIRTSTSLSFTWAGWWFVLFCVPLFQFLGLRWLWRLFLWAQFLWRMNQLKLNLIPTHPDEAGGLAFVGEAQRFFGIVLLAYSFSVAGVLANSVIYDKVPLPQYAPSIFSYVVFALILVLAPMCIFTGRLLKTKRSGLYQYGALATEYTSSFHQKWIVEQPPREEPLLGTGDIQSLADLGNSFSFIEKMNALPMGPRTPIHLALACLLPMSPLLLTVMPLGDVLKLLFKVVL
jgi:hypothetical protein